MQEVIPGIFYTLQFLGECFLPYWVINKNLLTDFSDWNLLIQLCLLPLQISFLRLNFHSLIYIPPPQKISSVILSYWKTNTTLLKLVGQKVSIKYHWGKLTDFLPASYVTFFLLIRAILWANQPHLRWHTFRFAWDCSVLCPLSWINDE